MEIKYNEYDCFTHIGPVTGITLYSYTGWVWFSTPEAAWEGFFKSLA